MTEQKPKLKIEKNLGYCEFIRAFKKEDISEFGNAVKDKWSDSFLFGPETIPRHLPRQPVKYMVGNNTTRGLRQ